MKRFNNFSVETLVLGVIEENCYIVRPNDSNECVVVDPGFPTEPGAPDFSVAATLKRLGLTPVAILVTHGHFDHIGGINELKELYPNLKIYVGENDAHKLTSSIANLSFYHNDPIEAQAADVLLKDGDVFELIGLTVRVLEIPGHSIGHVVYQFDDGANSSAAFCGDIVFFRSVGRTDFPDGNTKDLLDGIRNKLLTLPDETVLFPGHGPSTSVGEERRENPFVR